MSGHRERYDLETADYMFPMPDPGTGKPIPPIYGMLALTIGSSGAETNTLADPPRPGISLTISVGTRGTGTRAITAASIINQAGNTIMTFDNALDIIQLSSVFAGTTASGAPKVRWQVDFNDNVALS